MTGEFARGLVEVLITTIVRSREMDLLLTTGYGREVVEQFLVGVLVNIDLEEQYANAVIASFDELPEENCFSEQEQRDAVTAQLTLPATRFLQRGLPALTETSIVLLLLC